MDLLGNIDRLVRSLSRKDCHKNEYQDDNPAEGRSLILGLHI